MIRFVTLAMLAVIGVLMTGALPFAQSFNVGRIIVTRPIVLLSPARGPLEAKPVPFGSTASSAPARQFVESLFRLLTAPLPLEAGQSGSETLSIAPTVPQAASTPGIGERRMPTHSVVAPASGTEELPPPATMAAGPAAPPSAATTEETAGQTPHPPVQRPPAAPPQVEPRPGLDPARPGHGGSGHSGSGGGQGSGRG